MISSTNDYPRDAKGQIDYRAFANQLMQEQIEQTKRAGRALAGLSQKNVGSVRVIGTPDIVTKRLDDDSDIAREIEAGLNEQWDDIYGEYRFKSHDIIVDYTEIRRYVCQNAEESRVMWDYFRGTKLRDDERLDRTSDIRWMAHMDQQATAALWLNGQTDWAVYHVEEDR